jgi:heat-inducible transcriptional repressor
MTDYLKVKKKLEEKVYKKDRKYIILKSIIDIFVSTAVPVGSEFLKESSGMDLSSATLRSEMAKLEKEGLLTRSNISSGRIPTDKAYRLIIDTIDISKNQEIQFQSEFNKVAYLYFQKKEKDQSVYDVVSIVSELTENIVFSTIPSSENMFFLGVSQMINQTEFSSGFQDVSGVFKVLEEDLYNFLKILDQKKATILPASISCNYNNLGAEGVELFIGHENILSGIDSCSLLVSKGDNGEYFGILGPVRMNYSKNIVVMKEAQKLFKNMSF